MDKAVKAELDAKICDFIIKQKPQYVTITGGEPLLQPGMKQLLGRLRQEKQIRIEIETNGSVDVKQFWKTQAAKTCEGEFVVTSDPVDDTDDNRDNPHWVIADMQEIQ